MDVNDQAVRVRQEKCVVAREFIHFEHDARAARLKLGDSNLFEETVVHIERLSHQCGSELGIAQIEEDAVGVRNPKAAPFPVVEDLTVGTTEVAA